MNLKLRKAVYYSDKFAHMGILLIAFIFGWLLAGSVGMMLLELSPWFPLETEMFRNDLLTGMVFGTMGSFGGFLIVKMIGSGPIMPTTGDLLVEPIDDN